MANDWHNSSEADDDFDIKKWEALINSDDIFNEGIFKSKNTNENSNRDREERHIVKLSILDLQTTTFLNSGQCIQANRAITIRIPPSLNQRVRYANECEKLLRFISVPENKTMTIGIPDCRDMLLLGDTLWMRITRTTVNHRRDNLIFYHPYPIWITNRDARIHHGSIFIQITNKDMENGFLGLDTLTMIRLKQDDLAKIVTLGMYSWAHLDISSLHTLETRAPKRIRDVYKLRQSVLNFQLVRVDQSDMAYPTDCLCQTEPIHEIEANEGQQIVPFCDRHTIEPDEIDRRETI